MSKPNPFTVISVEPGQAPKLAQSGSWYRYEIANRHTRVVGRRCGTRDHVRRHAEEIADNLNQRARKGHSLWAPRRGRKTQ